MSDGDLDYLEMVRNVVLPGESYYAALDAIEAGLAAGRARLEVLKGLEREMDDRVRNTGNAAERLKKPLAVIDPLGIALQLNKDDLRRLVIHQEDKVRAAEGALKVFTSGDMRGYSLVRAADADRLSALDSINKATRFTWQVLEDEDGFRVRLNAGPTAVLTTVSYKHRNMAEDAWKNVITGSIACAVVDDVEPVDNHED